MKIAVAQLGARMHYAVPRIFHEAGLLERFFTDSYAGDKPWLEAALRAIPGPVRPRGVERWLGRREPAIPAGKVTSFELFGLQYARARARAGSSRELARARAFTLARNLVDVTFRVLAFDLRRAVTLSPPAT